MARRNDLAVRGGALPGIEFAVPALLLALALTVLGDVLLSGGASVPARQGTDLSIQFLAWRDLTGRELGSGRLPLWNPHIFSGSSFVGGFQSALFYPPTWLHIFLPLGQAINITAALHVFLAGLFAAWWARRLGAGRAGAFLAGCAFMFSGPFFLHLGAGHLSQVGVMAWTPLLFLSLDGWLDERRQGWLLLGSAALALMVLAGNPQYVYYAVPVSALYLGLRLWSSGTRRSAASQGTAALGAAGLYGLGLALAAVQLLPGLETARESVRSGGVSLAFASQVSLPPENLLTLLVPGILGDMNVFPYFGRWYLWETCLFVGIGTLLLAAMTLARENGPRPRILAGTAILCLLVALGPLTPLYSVLYHAAPMFASFRGSAKCAFLAALFLSVLAGVGCERLWKTPSRGIRPLPVAVAACSLLFAVTGLWLFSSPLKTPASWAALLDLLAGTRVTDIPASRLTAPTFVGMAAWFAGEGLLTASFKLALYAGLLFSSGWRRVGPSAAGKVFVVLAACEMLMFGFGSRASMSSKLEPPAAWETALADKESGARFLIQDLAHANSGMAWKAGNIWGHDPLLSRRYAEFMAATQGLGPDKASQYLQFTEPHPAMSLLRLRHILQNDETRPVVTLPMRRWMPRVSLMTSWTVLNNRDEVLGALFNPGLNLAETVVLESEPFPDGTGPGAHGASPRDYAKVLAETTDTLDIEARTVVPAVLLITDAWAPGWRASSLDAGYSQKYKVIPADHTLRAVPLFPGNHRLRLRYSPSSFRVGAAVSLLSLAGLLILACRLKRRP
ncbi:MAG: hypothetical protein HZB91_13525 [Elusimicrobia bacterium]|nr:hypothetical protein [Elusimicrobiota bacterium]